MKIVAITAALSLSLIGNIAAEEVNLKDLQDKVDALMKEQKAEEAVVLLQKSLEEKPDDIESLRKLGMIYTIIFKQPAKGAPLLEKGAKSGDLKSLQTLALAQILLKDERGMLAFKKQYVDNFEKLSGSRAVCFYIAGLENDADLFSDLLKKTPEADLEKDTNLCVIIARTAKALVHHD